MWVPSQKVANNFGQFQSSEQHTAGTRECIPGPVFSFPEIGNVQTSFPGIRKCMAGRQCFQTALWATCTALSSLCIDSLLAVGGLSDDGYNTCCVRTNDCTVETSGQVVMDPSGPPSHCQQWWSQKFSMESFDLRRRDPDATAEWFGGSGHAPPQNFFCFYSDWFSWNLSGLIDLLVNDKSG